LERIREVVRRELVANGASIWHRLNEPIEDRVAYTLIAKAIVESALTLVPVTTAIDVGSEIWKRVDEYLVEMERIGALQWIEHHPPRTLGNPTEQHKYYLVHVVGSPPVLNWISSDIDQRTEATGYARDQLHVEVP
jgi:hypothetical protein